MGRFPRLRFDGQASNESGGHQVVLRLVSWLVIAAPLAVIPVAPTYSQAPPTALGSPRAATHDGYGRIVFDWDGPVHYSADVINGELVLRFDRPVKGEFRNLLRPLGKYLRNVSASADHKTATFPLARAVQIKAFTGNNNTVVVDLVDQADEASPVPAPAPAPAAAQPGEQGPMSLLPPAAPASPGGTAPAKPRPPAASSELATVDVRDGEHGDYNRFVFAWPSAVDYKVEKQGNRAIIVFAKPARVDLASVQSALPQDIQVVGAESSSKSTTVTLTIPKDARLRHFASGPKVVLDIMRSAGQTQPAATTANVPDVALPSLKPLAPQEKPKLPSESLSQPSALSPVKPTSDSKSAAKAAPAVPPAAAAQLSAIGNAPAPKANAAEAVPAAAGQTTNAAAAPSAGADKVFSLSVAWDKPTAAAVFQRAGYLWVVFDRRTEVDTKLLHRLGGEAVTEVQQIPNRDATVLRLVVQPDYSPSVRRDGLLWVIDLMHQPMEPKAPIAVTAPAVVQNNVGITLDVAEAGNVITVADPEVGDSLDVVPVITLGAGVYPGRDFPDLELLPTIQGVALAPHVDGVDVRSSRAGVSIGLPLGGGLRVSTLGASPVKTAKGNGRDGFFDVASWKRSDDFPAERKKVEDGLALIPPAGRSAAHLDAARFFFAHGYAAEALGFLRLAADEEPTLMETGPYRALRGACQALMSRWDLALADLDSPLVKDDAESRIWQAAAHVASTDQSGAWEKTLALGLPIVAAYPKPLAWPVAALTIRAAIAAGDDSAAQQSLDILDRVTPSKLQDVQLDFLHGAFNEMAGQFDKALDDYDHAASGDNREYHAKASMAAAELLLKLNRITPKEAADRLDKLRFAWREEDFEFALLKRLAELQVQAGDYPEALRSLRSLANNYPDNKGAPVVSKMMADAFARLYLDGAADSLSPVSAIGLYDEFRDLTPTGAKGDEMIRKLADRLAAVDLLDRAAELLKHQVGFRLQGLDKGRVGAQLALLDLLNRQPKEALDALQTSAVDGLPAELQSQRKHLQARALADADRVPEAIQILAGDNGPEALQLRAEIYWRKQDWPNAATALEALVQHPDSNATLDDVSARLVVSWATALCLGNDERGLAALRRSFGPAMSGTAYRDGFSLLTSALDRDVPDMPAIAAKIKEAQGFLTFMSNYRKRLQSSGLSRIN